MYDKKVSLLPISRLPATHPAILKPTCGTKLSVDDPIPATSIARWTLGGQKSWKSAGDCKNAKLRKLKYYEQTAPQLFYAYGYPRKNTGNPGYYSPDAASLYPIVDAEDVRPRTPPTPLQYTPLQYTPTRSRLSPLASRLSPLAFPSRLRRVTDIRNRHPPVAAPCPPPSPAPSSTSTSS